MLRVSSDHFHASDTGRSRKLNEDRWFARSPLFGVADGMGGANAGEVASQMAVDVLERGLPDGDGSPEERLAGLLIEANRAIHTAASGSPELAGMGTTTTVAWVGDDELAIAHVGDSRMYLLRDGAFSKITRDHSLVEDLVQQGHITADEAEHHPQSNIVTRVLGPFPDVDVDHFTYSGRAGDVYLICSDGLTSMVSEERVADTLRRAPTLKAAGRALVDAANAAGGKDNITVVLFRLEEVGAPAAPGLSDATMVGDGAPQAAEVRAALAAQGTAEPRTRPDALATAAPVPRRAPRPVEERPGRLGRIRARWRRRRRLGVLRTIGFLTIFGVPILLGAYIATQSVYFLGTNDGGFASLYRGVPYQLPFGVNLYSENFASGVPTRELARSVQHTVSDHELRSRKEASNLLANIERGTLDPTRGGAG